MILRPFAVFLDGRFEFGLEVGVEDGRVGCIRPQTGTPENFILSPAFVNAHSHLEYRGMQDAIDEAEYLPWIREITRRKSLESDDDVREACRRAALENRRAGVAALGEHSDRPFAPAAMTEAGLKGVVFQEVITFLERDDPETKLAAVRHKAVEAQRETGLPTFLSPHAYQTVDRATLASIARSGDPFSMHVAETPHETALTRDGRGGLAEMYARFGFEPPITGRAIVPTLAELGLARRGAQFVHACDVDDEAISIIASAGVTVAHCPRSNVRLGCPVSPVRRLLSAGVVVGLGLDSPASSGPIDVFDEMRSALTSAERLGEPLSIENVWTMATQGAARSIPGFGPLDWRIEVGGTVPLIRIQASPTIDVIDALAATSPSDVSWVEMDDRT